MVQFLVLIKLLDSGGLNVAGPENVPETAIVDELEASVLKGVNEHIVDMGRVAYLERHEKLLDLLYLIDAEPLAGLPHVLAVLRVREVRSWRPLIEDRFQEVYLAVRRAEDAVGQAALLFLEKGRAQGVIFQVGKYLLRHGQRVADHSKLLKGQSALGLRRRLLLLVCLIHELKPLLLLIEVGDI